LTVPERPFFSTFSLAKDHNFPKAGKVWTGTALFDRFCRRGDFPGDLRAGLGLSEGSGRQNGLSAPNLNLSITVPPIRRQQMPRRSASRETLCACINPHSRPNSDVVRPVVNTDDLFKSRT
jgi:hypothetical protein